MVANAGLLAVIEDAICFMRWCSLNSSIRLIIDSAVLSFCSCWMRSTSSVPAKLEEIGLIAQMKL